MPFSEQTLSAFGAALASGDPTPGGGGACALAGALGAALGNMVGCLTVGKKRYAAVEADILALNARAEKLRETLLSLIERDAAAFAPLAEAYGIPKDAPGRDEAMERALRGASAVPLEIMEAACAVIALLEEYEEKGAAIAVSDAGVGALCARAALCGAGLNVCINTKMMKDRAFATTVNRQVDERLEHYLPRADAVYERVAGRLRQEGP